MQQDSNNRTLLEDYNMTVHFPSKDNTANWYQEANNYGTDNNIQNIPTIT